MPVFRVFFYIFVFMEKLRIRQTPDELINKIKILARDRGETVSDFLRPIIREISNKNKTDNFSNCDLSELALTGISKTVMEKLKNKSKKIGVTVPQLLRLELFYFIENQSEFNKSLFETPSGEVSNPAPSACDNSNDV